MKKTKEKVKQTNFTKLTHAGISLIVLVITIIVIIILSTAIIVSVVSNNPINEANTARYESDVDSMQAVFTNTVTKIMAQNQGTVSVTAGQINTATNGVKETTGEVAYTVTNAVNSANSNGTIVFDKGENTETEFYTGKKLSIYAAGETKWHVDEDGNISLEVAGKKYGNGEIVNIPENALINMYEDYAADEDGATVGKLHIGDYVDYNPIATGVTEKTEENGYVYVLKNDVSGVSEAIADNDDTDELNGVTEQRVTAKDNLKWRVLGISGNNVLITTEDVIIPDNPITEDGVTGFYMSGAKMYLNGVTEINNISKVYGNGDLAESATGMTIDHVNKITGVTVTESEILPSGIEMNSALGWNAYGSSYSFAAGSNAGWDPKSWLEKKEGETSPGISGVSNAYVYQLSDSKLKTASSSVRYSLLDYTGSSVYGLACRGVVALSNSAYFGFGAVSEGMAWSAADCFYSLGYSNGFTAGVRPVVSLKANVIGQIQSTDTSGVATWHIELN